MVTSNHDRDPEKESDDLHGEPASRTMNSFALSRVVLGQTFLLIRNLMEWQDCYMFAVERSNVSPTL